MSDDTARKIDSEIHRIIEEQYQRATDILAQHRDALDKVAEALLEYETIDGKHVLEILQFGELRSPVVSSQPPKAEPPAAKKQPEKPAAVEPVAPAAAPHPA